MHLARPQAADSAPAPTSEVKAALIFAVTCGAQFMVIIDDTVVNIALPSIRDSLGFEPASLAWVVDAYMLLFGGFLVLGGRVADLFGRRRVFRAGLVLFTGASFVGGIAQNPEVLVGARAAQGLGAAMLSPAALSILITAFDSPERRRKALGVWGGLTGLSGFAGVLLGGIVTDTISWRWVFFINLPICLLLWTLTLSPSLADRKHRDTERAEGLDVMGALLVTAGILLLVYSVLGTERRDWSSPITVLGLIGAAVLLALFVLRESRAKEPLIRLALFAKRQITAANVMMVLAASGLYGVMFFLTQYMQTVHGWSPMRTSLSWSPFGFTMAVFSGIAIQLLPRVGGRLLCLVGLSLATLGHGLLLGTAADSSYAGSVLPTMLLTSSGYGLAFVPMVVAAVSGTRKEEAGVASGLLNTSQQVGGALGLAVLATFASEKLADKLGGGAPMTDALMSSYHAAFVVSTVLTAGAALTALLLPALRTEFDPAAAAGA